MVRSCFLYRNNCKNEFFVIVLSYFFWEFFYKRPLRTCTDLIVWRLLSSALCAGLFFHIFPVFSITDINCFIENIRRSNVVELVGCDRVFFLCMPEYIFVFVVFFLFLFCIPSQFLADCLRNLKKIRSVVEITMEFLLRNVFYYKISFKFFVDYFQSFIKFFNMMLWNGLIKLIDVCYFFILYFYFFFYGSNKNNILYYNSRCSQIGWCRFSYNRFCRCRSWYWNRFCRFDSRFVKESSLFRFIVSLCYFRFCVNRSYGFVSHYDGVFNFEQLINCSLLKATSLPKISWFFKSLKRRVFFFQDGSLSSSWNVWYNLEFFFIYCFFVQQIRGGVILLKCYV